jgi:hypothetical protein
VTIRFLQQPPEPALRSALDRFEAAFRYPLGEGESFRISHGDDYSLFFRAISPGCAASCLALEANGEIRGTLGVAIRPLHVPHEGVRQAAYLGDLKVRPGAGAGRTLVRLAAAVTDWAQAHGATCGYGVVMDGTARLPLSYTGRLGVPAFRRAGQICLLRVPIALAAPSSIRQCAAVESCHRALTAEGIAPLGGDSNARSLSPPRGFVSEDNAACGVLEDTRRAKRLLLDDGREMLVAHLSQFAYRTAADGVRLIRHVLSECVAPAMFVAVPEQDAADFRALLGESRGITEASATIFATGVDNACGKWHIGTSEI